MPLDVDENTLNIECINHILYGDDKNRNFEYYNQLNTKYKTILDKLLADNDLQIDVSNDSLTIVHSGGDFVGYIRIISATLIHIANNIHVISGTNKSLDVFFLQEYNKTNRASM